MNNYSLYQFSALLQEDTVVKKRILPIEGLQVLCPMCEVWHRDNTNCQRND